MKKNLVSILALAAMFTLAGCGEKTSDAPISAKSSDTPTTDKNSTSTTDTIKVTGVSITNSDGAALSEDELTVLDGTNVTLKASVTANKTGLKVTWSSSNTEVAKVTNGVVRFLSVSAETDVTITATSKDDTTKSASVTFHVKHSMIDFSSSRATDLDTSEFLSDGKITTSVGDTALVYADVYGTKWYVQADITYTAFSESDAYPKFGIMTGNKAGVWSATTESDICYNNFFYLDTNNPNSSSSWSNFNTVVTDNTYANWNWGGQLGGFNYNYKRGETLTLGLLRDGQDYYQFVTKQNEDGTPGELVCKKHVVDTLIPADQATYAWVGGWATAAEVSNFKSLSGNAVDSMYGTPSSLNVNGDGTTLYIQETYQLNVSADFINFDSKKLTYVSSDETVATVSDTGLVTAKNKAGSTEITISYGTTLTKKITINVTDDIAFKVDVDGKMDDVLWSDKVKANFYRLNLNGAGEYIDFYGAKNSRGIYLFAKAHVNAKKNDEGSSDWWENDNFEGRFVDTTTKNAIEGPNISNHGQWWISANKTSNLDEFYVSDVVLNEETNKYDIVYETFTSYDTLNVGVDANTYNINTPIAIYVGSNPASGWKAADFFDKADAALRVTTDGFMHADGKYCSDGDHEYGNWVVTKENTCGEDGIKTRTCKYCAHEDTDVIAADASAHKVDLSKGTVKSKGTCSTDAVVECVCEVCGQTVNANGGKDRSNHEGYVEAEHKCTTCGETVIAGDKLDLDKSNSGGPYADTVTFQHSISGDFTAVIKTSNTTTTNGTSASDNVWRTTFPVIFDAADHGNGAFFRWDWCQFTQGNGWSEASNTGIWKDDDQVSFDFNTEMFTLVTSFTTDTTITRVGNLITINSVIHPTAEAYSSRNFHYTSTIKTTAASLDLCLGAEFAKGSVELVSIK